MSWNRKQYGQPYRAAKPGRMDAPKPKNTRRQPVSRLDQLAAERKKHGVPDPWKKV